MHRSARFRFSRLIPRPFITEFADDLCTYAVPVQFHCVVSCSPRIFSVLAQLGGIGSIGLLTFLIEGMGIVKE